MKDQTHNETSHIRYAVDEKPGHLLSAALGFQVVVLIVAGIALVPVLVLKAAGNAEEYIAWAVFAALFISGLITIVQARPIGPIGAGYVLFMGTSGSFIAISISAVKAGGLPLLASLIIISSLIQFIFSARLSLLRRIVTPTVGGTVIMLISVTAFPICFNMLSHVPDTVDKTSLAAPLTAAGTFLITVAVSLFAKGAIRLWGPLIGAVTGCFIAWFFGLFDPSLFINASWVGFPDSRWPGLSLTPGFEFWTLLPGFILVTIIGAIETYGDGIAIQHVSQRLQKPVSYKAVQGAVYADGLGNLLSGLLGTLPNTTYSTSVAVVEMTGVGARRVGIYGGLFLILLAFSPKVSALLQAIPGPVAGVYIIILLVLLFAHGVRLVVEDGFPYENAFIVCLSFWVGVGFQNLQIFPDHMPEWAHTLLDNGMTSGGLTALTLTLILSLKERAAYKITLTPENSAIPSLHGFAVKAGRSMGWNHNTITRLELVCEEAFIFLTERIADTGDPMQQIKIQARSTGSLTELEFISSPNPENLENLESLVQQLRESRTPSAEDAGLRILKHLTEDIRHQQFNNGDILIMKVESKPILSQTI